MLEARALERSDPAQSLARYRELIALQPGFAETHFRLARLLDRENLRDEAYREYVLARDLDGHPMRCPTTFQDVYRELAGRFGAILVDGQSVLRDRHPRRLLDDDLFNDAMHPSFEGQVALAEAVLSGLRRARGVWLARLASRPRDRAGRFASHFDITTATWKEVCRFAAGFYRTTLPHPVRPRRTRGQGDSPRGGAEAPGKRGPRRAGRSSRDRHPPGRRADRFAGAAVISAAGIEARRLGALDRGRSSGTVPGVTTVGSKQGQSRWATAWAGSLAIRASSCLR